MVTNEPIVSTGVTVPEPAPTYVPEPVAPPSFSTLERSGRSSGGGWFLKVALVVVVLAAVGFFAWQQPRVRQYAQNIMQRVKPAPAISSGGTSSSDGTAPDQSTIRPPAQSRPSSHEVQNPPQATTSASEQAAPSMNFNDETPPESSVPAASAKSSPSQNIELQELPLSRDAKVNAAPKMQPIVVKNGIAVPHDAQQPSAPPVNLISDANHALPSVTPTNFELPKAAPGTIRISQGVSQGLLIKKVQPRYPDIARQLRRQGTVQLLATIDKYGETTRVQVLTGDPMLARSAVEAVKQWEYRPYLLNGQPVEIETQITVVFNGD